MARPAWPERSRSARSSRQLSRFYHSINPDRVFGTQWHGRRQVIWFGVTTHPTAEWIANQITEACGWEQAPRYLIRDRDGAYGEVFIRRIRSMGIRDQPTSPRSPWQNGYAERLIGSIRRECLDHVVALGECHLRHLLLSYMKYYNGTRTHLSLEKDAPFSRAVERAGQILCRPILGGLHHQYVRILFSTGKGLYHFHAP